MFVEQDVAEDDVRDAHRRGLGQRAIERGVVGSHVHVCVMRLKAEPLDLRGEDLGPQAVRPAARAVLVEHRDRGDEVEGGSCAVVCRARVLSAAPGNGGCRARH